MTTGSLFFIRCKSVLLYIFKHKINISLLSGFSMSFWIFVHLRLFSLNYTCEEIGAKVNIFM